MILHYPSGYCRHVLHGILHRRKDPDGFLPVVRRGILQPVSADLAQQYLSDLLARTSAVHQGKHSLRRVMLGAVSHHVRRLQDTLALSFREYGGGADRRYFLSCGALWVLLGQHRSNSLKYHLLLRCEDCTSASGTEQHSQRTAHRLKGDTSGFLLEHKPEYPADFLGVPAVFADHVEYPADCDAPPGSIFNRGTADIFREHKSGLISFNQPVSMILHADPEYKLSREIIHRDACSAYGSRLRLIKQVYKSKALPQRFYPGVGAVLGFLGKIR